MPLRGGSRGRCCPLGSPFVTGLVAWVGLALARQLVAAHGGTMEVVSEAGQGTLVRVSLPRGA